MAKNETTQQTPQVDNAEELARLKALLAEKEKQATEAQARAAAAEKQAAEATAQLDAIAAENEKNATAAANDGTKNAEQKMVKIRLPKTRKDEGAVFVSVNDYTCLVQRGVEVEVPDFVAEVLQHREEMLLSN